MRILIADDHPLFRDGISSLLRARGHQIVAEAGNGREAIEQTRVHLPDIVIMDLGMPEIDGLTATRLISSEMPEVRIFIVTVSEEDDDLYEAIKSGAVGYMIKNMESHLLFELLEDISRGETGIPPALANRVLTDYPHEPTGQESGSSERLTRRERDVLTLMVAGVTSTSDLADHLVISENTVKYHLRNILDKLHLHNRAAVVAHAIRHGIVPARGAGSE